MQSGEDCAESGRTGYRKPFRSRNSCTVFPRQGSRLMHEQMMKRALELAKEAQLAGEVPVGAVVACGGTIISQGRNEREQSGDPTAHAEVLALRRAAEVLGRRRLEGCVLYVTLEPCPMCAGTAIMAGVSEIVYGAYDLRCGCAGSVYDLPEDRVFGKVIPCTGGVLEEECREVLDAFFFVKRK